MSYSEYCLTPGCYCIGDPLIMLNKIVYDTWIIESGLHIYNGCISIINQTGFEEGTFKDIELTEYVITSGYIGIFPILLCSDKSFDILNKYGKCIHIYSPFFVHTNEEGYFSIHTPNYNLILDTSIDTFEETDLI